MVSDGGPDWREIAEQRGLEVERLQRQKQQLTASLLKQTESHRESAEAENDLRADVERLTQENTRLRELLEDRIRVLAAEHSAAERDVIEKAKALYVAMICDRHTDPEPYVFSTAEAAIAYARDKATEYARDPDDLDEPQVPDGWLYYATYSGEDDSVWVIEKVLDQPAEEASDA